MFRRAGHPVVWAHNKHQPGRQTVLIYGHYDVQPPDPLEMWESPPFEPVLKNGYVFARGATDNKGQILSHILGVQESIEQNRDLPVNIHLVIEGEEEIGSANLGQVSEAKSRRAEMRRRSCFRHGNDRARRADVELWLARCDRVRSQNKRSENGFALRRFRRRRCKSDYRTRAIARHASRRDGHVAIAGFYDHVKPLEDWEREAWRKFPIDVDNEFRQETGVPELFGEAGYNTVERIWARPTAEINGIGGGYQGQGTKTVIASHAMAKLTFRLVPDQDGEEILKLASAHLQKHLPPGVTMEITDGHSGPWYLTDPHSKTGEAAHRALRKAFNRDVALIREGGSIPIVSQFRGILGIETLLMGLALPDCRAHSPNENFPLENLEGGIRLNKAMLQELALD